MIGDDIHASVYDKRDDFIFPNANTWLSGDVLLLLPYGIYISQLITLLDAAALAFQISIQKSTNHFLIVVTRYRYHKLRKYLGFFMILLLTFIDIWCFTVSRICSKGNFPLGLDSNNLISSGTTMVKRLRRVDSMTRDHLKDNRSYTWPFFAICRLFPVSIAL